MIYGVGLDLVELERIEDACRRWGERFVTRVLAADELAQWRRARQPDRFVARRFAVKEAASKALGTGMREGVSFRSIAVTHDALGKPQVEFRAGARARAGRLGIVGAHVSITDERALVAAVVVLETAD